MTTINENNRAHGRAATKKQIAIVLCDGCDLLGLATLVESLEYAGSLSQHRVTGAVSYETHFLSRTGGYIRCALSLSVSTRSLEDFIEQRFDHVIVTQGQGDKNASGDVLHGAWVQRMRQRGASVTALQAVNADNALPSTVTRSPLNEDYRTPTSTNRAAPVLRAAFDMIRNDLGDEVAREAIRLATGEREATAAVETIRTPADKARFAARWIRENSHRELSIADIADACASSERSLLRYFQAYVGTSPSEYLQQVRVELACDMLATTSLPADKIARRVGLSNGDRLGKILRRVTGMSPTEYRANAHLKAEMDGHRDVFPGAALPATHLGHLATDAAPEGVRLGSS
jgi:transcriptional regulator GlxA family with amidase domain